MTEQERAERLRHHMYDTCEGIQQQSERIVALEELVGDLYKFADGMCNQRNECSTCMFSRTYQIDGDTWTTSCPSNELYARIESLGVPL